MNSDNSEPGDHIQTGHIEGVGIAIGTRASVNIYGDVHYYPIKLRVPLRRQFDGLLEQYTQLFGGREIPLARIADFICDPTGGYLVITAPAGFGKTALMANLVSRTPEAFAYHFFNPVYVEGSTSEVNFLRNVLEQIAQWHGHKEELPERLDELAALYHQFIDEPLDRTQVLVLDGLDEVSRWKLDRYLMRRLPERMHIILSVRDVGQDWQAEYGLPPGQTTHLPLGGLTIKEIAEVLHAAGGQAAILAEDIDVLAEVSRIAAYQADAAMGVDPFYVRLLAEDAVAGLLTADNVARQPQGLEHYLDAWWQQVKQLAGDRAAQDLFGTLAAALGPIGRADLEAINPSLVGGWAGDFFEDIVDKVRRFVVGNARHGYTLAHPRLRQYVGDPKRIKHIASYQEKLLDYCSRWSEHQSPYALTYYPDHLHAAGQTEKLYQVVLNKKFRRIQRDVLGDTSATLESLRLVLSLALAGDDLVKILTCTAAYRQTVRSQSIAQAIFDAVDTGDFERALRLARIYGPVPDWASVLHLYLAWEAVQAGRVELGRRATTAGVQLPLVQAAELADALLVRTAMALANNEPNQAKKALAGFGRDDDADDLLSSYPLAQPISPAEAEYMLADLDNQLGQLEQMATSGDVEGIHDVLHLEYMADEVWANTRSLRDRLLQVAAHPATQQSLDLALNTILSNPYPRYRDMGLVEFGLVSAAVPNISWTRHALRRILQAGLDREGVNFTFDLPFLLAAELQKRHLPLPPELHDYVQRAWESHDRWGTSLRARNAQAAALLWQGAVKTAVEELEAAIREPNGYAGYATLHLLALANRWQQFGQPEQAATAGEGQSDLLEEAERRAENVRAEDFREDRLQLVATYRTWWEEETPDVDSGLARLSRLVDADVRLAYIDHISARWVWPADKANWLGLKELLPQALVDGTTLDAVLARLTGVYLSRVPDHHISEAVLTEATHVVTTSLLTGRPWELGGA